jgi:uncharacterized iron-regulated protein
MQKPDQQDPVKINRVFEQPGDMASFYSDVAQVISTGQEIVLQFYETIPGSPDANGKMSSARSRLRATITLSMSHARNIGKLLLDRVDRPI